MHKIFYWISLYLISLPLALAQPVVWILDGSASMQQAFGPTDKTSLVTRTLIKLSTNWPAQTPLGIISDSTPSATCANVTTLAPLAPLRSPATLNAQLKSYRATGKSALGTALKTAAQQVKEQAATMVVISDGVDDCGLDLCALSQQLHADSQGQLTIQVIGLGIPPAQEEALRCLAERNNGHYTTVTTAQQLLPASQEALNTVFKRSMVQLNAAYTPNDPIQKPSLWKLYQIEANQQRILKATLHAPIFEQPLLPGNYIATVRHEWLNGELAFTAAEGQPVTQTILLPGSAVQLNLVLNQKGTPPLAGTWRVYQHDTTGKPSQIAAQANRTTPQFVLPAGQYRITVTPTQGVDTLEHTLTLTAGKTIHHEFILKGSEVQPQAILPENEPKEITWLVYRQSSTQPLLTSMQEKPRFILSPGQYRLEAKQVNGYTGQSLLTIPLEPTLQQPMLSLTLPAQP